jgi:hypothetical protein
MTTPMTFAAIEWLRLAAAPTFAVMAWISSGDPMALCTSGPGLLPLGGMVLMYLLMSLFHLPPWLTLVSHRGTATPLNNRTEGH